MKKRIISLVLAVVLLFSVPSVAYADDGCNCGNVPIVYVDGINAQPLVDENGTQVFAPDTNLLVSSILSAVPSLILALVMRNWSIAEKAISTATAKIFEPVAMNPDGTSKNPAVDIGMDLYSGITADMHSNNERYYFAYDWRLDPTVSAEKLNTFIDKVCEVTGHSKIALVSHSCGGSVVMTYLSEYGNSKLESLVFRSSAFLGTSLVGEVLTKQLDINSAAVLRFVDHYLQRSDSDELTKFVAVAEKTGIIDVVVALLNVMIENMADGVYENCLIDCFGRMPGIWALCASEDFDAAKAAMLGENPNAELLSKIDNYHINIQLKVKSLIDASIANGVRVAFFSSYNSQGTPICVTSRNNTDNLIDTKYTSGGATVALLGETLGSGYVQKNACSGHNHLSADGVIDASTCFYPDYTWFIKNLGHSERCEDEWNTVLWFITSGEQKTVFSDTVNYPQFLVFNVKAGTLSTLK